MTAAVAVAGAAAIVAVANPFTAGAQTVCSGAWQSGAVYVGGDRVSHNGTEYRAKWWTTNEEPGTTGEWGVWESLGACGEDGGEPTEEPTDEPTEPTDPVDPPTEQYNVAYFTEWGVYGRDYHVKDIVTSGSAEKLTHIVYAFGNVQN